MDPEILISSSSTEPAPPPHLLRLPNELLDTIFSFAYEDPEDRRRLARRPVCHRLAAIQRVHLYRRVELQTYESLAAFLRVLRTVGGTAKLVVDLTLNLEDERNAAPADDSVEDESGSTTSQDARHGRSGRQKVAPADLEVIVPSLTALTTLVVSQLALPLLKVLLLDETASASLISLKQLEIEDGQNSGDSFRAAWESLALVESLARLPRLEDLTITQCGQHVKIMPKTGATAVFPRLKRLSLQGMYAPDWLVDLSARLDRMAPHLVDLELVDCKLQPWIAHVLATACPSLRKISLLCGSEAMDTRPPASIHDALLRFKDLEHLELGNGVFDPWSPTALDSLLSHKYLRTLTLTECATTDALLVDILDNAHRLPHLARIVINHRWPCRGRTVKAMCGSSRRLREPDWPMWPGWHTPEYPPGCSESGLRTVLQAAETRGVVVEGNALNALDWRSAFEAERRAAHLAHGDETGDYRLARQVLGDAVVDEHLVERS